MPILPSPHPDDRAGLLDDILTHARISCEFQPVIDIESGELVAVEALARGPEGTPLERPSRLFATARALGRVAELDWTCRIAAITAAADTGLPAGCSLFINVDPAALAAPAPEQASAALAATTGLPIAAEINERGLLVDPDVVIADVHGIRELGWQVTLDDAGSDLESMRYLSTLSPDMIKFDVRLVLSRPPVESEAITNALRAYATEHGSTIIAEGIESPVHLDTARALGASLAQGWHFAGPSDLTSTLADHAAGHSSGPLDG